MRDQLGQRIGVRKWVAWKLVVLAHRIYDASWYQVVRLPGDLRDRHIVIEASEYGGGVFASTGFDWLVEPPEELLMPVVVDFDDVDSAFDWADS